MARELRKTVLRKTVQHTRASDRTLRFQFLFAPGSLSLTHKHTHTKHSPVTYTHTQDNWSLTRTGVQSITTPTITSSTSISVVQHICVCSTTWITLQKSHLTYACCHTQSITQYVHNNNRHDIHYQRFVLLSLGLQPLFPPLLDNCVDARVVHVGTCIYVCIDIHVGMCIEVARIYI